MATHDLWRQSIRGLPDGRTVSDADLLARFRGARDPAAFELLVYRHGPMVWATCRRLLSDHHATEDAFQATFLALARQAGRIRASASVPAWLHRVAVRAGLDLLRRKLRISPETDPEREPIDPRPGPADRAIVADLSTHIDAAINRLPERMRRVFVLCQLKGISLKEAADELGCPLGTVESRLARAKRQLRRALAHLQPAASAGLLATIAVPQSLRADAVRAAIGAGRIAPNVAALAARATRGGWGLAGPGLATAIVATLLVVAIGLGQPETPKPPTKAPPTKEQPASPQAARTDRFGDPLPEGAVMRLGTVGFRLPNVTGVGFRKSGEIVAFSDDRTLSVWPADGSVKPKVTAAGGGSGYYGSSRAISADARFATSDQGGKVVVWEVVGDKLVEYLSRDARNARRSVFSPNGAWLAVNASGIILCDLAAKKWIDVPGPSYTDCLSFTLDGKWLAVTTDRDVRVIDTAAGKERYRIAVPRVRPRFAALSPDGSILAVLPTQWIHDPDPTVRLLSVPSGAEVAGLKGPAASAHWVGFSPDGKTILTGGWRGIREWDPVANKLVREIPGPAQAPVVYSADGKRLATHSECAVLVWDTTRQKPLRPDLAEAGHTEAVRGITVSPDGKLIATNARDGEILVWATDSGRLVCRARTTGSYDRRVAFLPDSKSFVTVAEDYVTPVIRDSTTAQELRRFTVPAERAKTETTHQLWLSADGKTLITATRPVRAVDKSYAIRWDMDTGRPVDRTEEPEDWRRDDLSPAVRSPDGRWRAQAGKVSRVGGTEEMQLVPPDESLMMTATFSADSRLVASPRTPRAVLTGGPPDGGLVVFDLEIKARVAELPTGQVIHYAFTPDGKQVVVIGRDETVLWDLASGKPSRRYRSGHTNHLRAVAVAFTPNGRRLITGHDDCTALVWDLTGTGRISRKDAPELSADALARLWDDLAGDDAGKAHTAGWELADRPERAVALLRERVKPVRSADDAAVRGLVAKLDVPAFATREAAEKQLRELGETAVPALRAALKAGVSDEQKVRVDRLLAAAATPVIGPGDRLRQLRAVAVLERAGTDDARKLLDELAGGVSEARLTREAAAAIRRLSVPKP